MTKDLHKEKILLTEGGQTQPLKKIRTTKLLNEVLPLFIRKIVHISESDHEIKEIVYQAGEKITPFLIAYDDVYVINIGFPWLQKVLGLPYFVYNKKEAYIVSIKAVKFIDSLIEKNLRHKEE